MLASFIVWLSNCKQNMDRIIQNPGLQHIVEKSLNYVDKKSIFQFRLVNSDCKRITDCPRLYLKKVSDENSSKDLIEEWEPLLKKIPSDDIKQHLTMELFKMYAERCPKKPLELAQDLAIGKKMEDIELVTFIIGNSNSKSFVKSKIGFRFIRGTTISAMHLASFFGFEGAARCVIANSTQLNENRNKTNY